MNSEEIEVLRDAILERRPGAIREAEAWVAQEPPRAELIAFQPCIMALLEVAELTPFPTRCYHLIHDWTNAVCVAVSRRQFSRAHPVRYVTGGAFFRRLCYVCPDVPPPDALLRVVTPKGNSDHRILTGGPHFIVLDEWVGHDRQINMFASDAVPTSATFWLEEGGPREEINEPD